MKFEFIPDSNTGCYGFYAVVTTPEQISVTGPDGNELIPENGLYSLPNRKLETPVYHFTFTKKWEGGTGGEIRWTLYDENGRAVQKKFTKQVISGTEWKYEAEFDTDPGGYYLVEKPQEGYDVKYRNNGKYEQQTGRLYNGGVLVNTKRRKIPQTGDDGAPAAWSLQMLLGMGGLFAVRIAGKRTGKRRK